MRFKFHNKTYEAYRLEHINGEPTDKIILFKETIVGGESELILINYFPCHKPNDEQWVKEDAIQSIYIYEKYHKS